jgi:hypothetical protein
MLLLLARSPHAQLVFGPGPINLRVGRLVVDGQVSAGGPGCRLMGPLTLTFVLPAPQAGVPLAEMGILVGRLRAYVGGDGRGGKQGHCLKDSEVKPGTSTLHPHARTS